MRPHSPLAHRKKSEYHTLSAEGRKAFVWFGVIEYPAVMRFILALGADGLMVNNPAALAKVLSR